MQFASGHSNRARNSTIAEILIAKLRRYRNQRANSLPMLNTRDGNAPTNLWKMDTVKLRLTIVYTNNVIFLYA